MATCKAARVLFLALALWLVPVASSQSTLVISPTAQTGAFVDVGDLNPHSYRTNEIFANDWVYEGLVRWDPASARPEDRGVVPALATSWTTSIDPVSKEYTITFQLRRGVKFHDGTEWNADAAALNFGHVMGGPDRALGPSFHDWFALSVRLMRWRAVSNFTFSLTFDSEYEPALRELCLVRPFRMISPASLPDLSAGELSCGRWFNLTFQGARTWNFNNQTYRCRGIRAPFGTGPYMADSKLLSDGRSIGPAEFNSTCRLTSGCNYGFPGVVMADAVFVRNPNWWGGKPAYDRLIARRFSSHAAAKQALLDGTLDMAYGLSALTVSDFLSIDSQDVNRTLVAYVSKVDLNTRMIVMNSHPSRKLDTLAKRKLVMRSIDRGALLDSELSGDTPTDTIFSRNSPFCNITLPSVADLTRFGAADAADIAKPLEIIYYKSVPHQSMIVAKVVADLYVAGITVTQRPLVREDYLNSLGAGNFDLAYIETWGPPYDPSSTMYDWTSKGAGGIGSIAHTGMAEPNKTEVEAMIGRAFRVTNDQERQSLYTSILTAFHMQAIYLPLSMKHNYAVVNSRVSGFSFGSTEYDIPVWRFFPTPPPKKDAVTPLTTGGIVGIAIGIAAFVCVVACMCYMIARERRGEPLFHAIPTDDEETRGAKVLKEGTSAHAAAV